MMTSDLLLSLLKLTLASSAALLIVLALRRHLQWLLGAAVCYAMWGLVPVSMIAVLLPHPQPNGTLSLLIRPGPLSTLTSVLQDPLAVPGGLQAGWQLGLVVIWALGVAVLFGYFCLLQRVFVRSLGTLSGARPVLRAESSAGCPVVMGLPRPVLVLPADFRSRYSPRERRLIFAHERAHLRHGDVLWNALVALLRCVFWFNPLAHLAAVYFRADQEMACDAAVIARHAGSRRTYGAAMLKTQLVDAPCPAACSWSSVRHLKERLHMLNRTLPGAACRAWGAGVILLTCSAGGCAAWTAGPAASQVTGTRIPLFTVEIDSHEVQILSAPGDTAAAGRMDFHAGFANLDNHAQWRGELGAGVVIQLYASKQGRVTVTGPSHATPDWAWAPGGTPSLVLEAKNAKMAGSLQKPGMTFEHGCIATWKDAAGKDYRKLTGATCTVQIHHPMLPGAAAAPSSPPVAQAEGTHYPGNTPGSPFNITVAICHIRAADMPGLQYVTQGPEDPRCRAPSSPAFPYGP